MESNENKVLKMVVFDMDNTLLEDRFIDKCAEAFNFKQAMTLVRQIDKDPISRTQRIAHFLHGRKKSELLEIADRIPLVPGTEDVVHILKQRSYIVGIISDSYNLVTRLVAKKINADFDLSNELVINDGIITGEVLIPAFFHYSNNSICKHQVCKTNALLHICKVYQVKPENCMAIGDSENDICMLQNAGMSVAFRTTSEYVERASNKKIKERSFRELLDFAL